MMLGTGVGVRQNKYTAIVREFAVFRLPDVRNTRSFILRFKLKLAKMHQSPNLALD